MFNRPSATMHSTQPEESPSRESVPVDGAHPPTTGPATARGAEGSGDGSTPANRSPREIYGAISENINLVMRGQEAGIRKLMAALAAGAHVLIEDYPGTGKTTLAKALAASVAADFKRIQFTPDLLPSDILGVSIYNQRDNSFDFHPGPIFSNILLGDEINRASPRTQSALLEAMAEGQVTIEGRPHTLRDLFFVIATQNPVEFRGTYPLPEAQMDRFGMQFSLGYVDPRDEVEILTAQTTVHPLESLHPVADLRDLMHIRSALTRVEVSAELKRYIVDLIGASRGYPHVQLAASPRASLTLMKCAQAVALFEGRDFVIPDDIQSLARDVIAHRLVLDSQSKFSGVTGRKIVEELLEKVQVPA
jgi:MoxR-like ATPase